MSAVTISQKFQVVIPRNVREQLQLKPGQKVEAIAHDGRVELIPIRPIQEMRGFVRGMETTVEREDDRL